MNPLAKVYKTQFSKLDDLESLFTINSYEASFSR